MHNRPPISKRPLTRLLFTAILAATPLPAVAADLQPTTLPKPLPVQLTLSQASERVNGTLLRYDADVLVVKTGKGEREIKWHQLTAPSRFALRSQLIDRKNPDHWLDLAHLAMQSDLKDQARQAVAQAARLDPKSKLKGDAILRAQGPAKPATSTSPAPSGDAATPEGEAGVIRYQKPTPQQEADALAKARKHSTEAQTALRLRLAEIETPHFLIFTDWPQDQHPFLKENLEAAYVAVARQFDIPPTENVFVGKLPVYMFDQKTDFERWAVAENGRPDAAGYYRGWSDGSGHMVMSKPDVLRWGPRMAQTIWARTLTHEFTHAFVARYRTNRFVPRWLNEGTAEVIALSQFPDVGAYGRALDMATKDFDFMRVFESEKELNADLYPVYYTLVEALAKDNQKAFIAMFNDIKDGLPAEEALKKHFKVAYKDLREPWIQYVRNRRN